MRSRITRHLRTLIDAGSAGVGRQYTPSPPCSVPRYTDPDPLGEDATYSVGKGLVHKYRNRILLKISYRCAAHCQFCTRQRQIGLPDGDLSPAEIENAFTYIRSHPEVEEVILSGGDPLYTPRTTTEIIERLGSLPQIRVIRIGTRLPLQAPEAIETRPVRHLLDVAASLIPAKAVFVLVHVNHPDELTPNVVATFRAMLRRGLILLSQSVFLRGVNDDAGILKCLFARLYWERVLPYYIYRCDRVPGSESFLCDIDKEIQIMTDIRKELSGIACPTYVIDVSGRGKLPVPLGFWTGSCTDHAMDFDGRELLL